MTVTLGFRLYQDPGEIEGLIALLALAKPGTRARLIARAERLHGYLAAQLHFLRQREARVDASDEAAAAELAMHLEAARHAEDDAAHVLAFLTHLYETGNIQTGAIQ